MYRSIIATLSLVVLNAISANGAQFFGPTPYLSAADSPFDLSGLGSTFWLEDFEDGAFNTPGVRQLRDLDHPPAVRLPSNLTDSVDADDGQIDGFGTGGHSLFPTLSATLPPLTTDPLILVFDSDVLGFVPTAVGFVWTDGTPGSIVGLGLFDASLTPTESFTYGDPLAGDLGDDRIDGTTGEDRFFGAVDPHGIYAVAITSTFVGDRVELFELDHFQYGLFVPEPETFLLAMGAIAVILITLSIRSVMRVPGWKRS